MNIQKGEIRLVRVKEQKKAAVLGEYAAQIFLDYPSTAVKNAADSRPEEDIALLLKATTPKIVYTHNPADMHDTHIGVLIKVLDALWQLPPDQRPKHMYGCEVWRNLDWLVDEDKIVFNTSARENLQSALVEVFDSQISGGKRYDLATMCRRRAHATYHDSYGLDVMTGAAFAMDLTPLIATPGKDIEAFTQEKIERFAEDVRSRLRSAR